MTKTKEARHLVHRLNRSSRYWNVLRVWLKLLQVRPYNHLQTYCMKFISHFTIKSFAMKKNNLHSVEWLNIRCHDNEDKKWQILTTLKYSHRKLRQIMCSTKGNFKNKVYCQILNLKKPPVMGKSLSWNVTRATLIEQLFWWYFAKNFNLLKTYLIGTS